MCSNMKRKMKKAFGGRNIRLAALILVLFIVVTHYLTKPRIRRVRKGVRLMNATYEPLEELVIWHNASSYTVKKLPPIEIFDNSSAGLRRYFYPTMTVAEQLIARDLLLTFINAVERANVTYFMFFGTLLGACRHAGMIPWDDDLDMGYLSSDSAALETALLALEPRYGVIEYYNRFKLFPNQFGAPIKDNLWRYPYIDVWSFTVTANEMWANAESHRKLSPRDFFPVVKRSFWGLNVSAPRRALHSLKKSVKNSVYCRSNYFNHRLEGHNSNPIIFGHCDGLKDLYDIYRLCED